MNYLKIVFFIVISSGLFLPGYAKPDSLEMSKMKTYYMVFLKKGNYRTQDSVTVQKIQEGHMMNINKLAESGKLIVAGPFLDDGELRGIFIFDVKSINEAVELTENDPAVKSGRLGYDIHPWMTQKGTCFK